MMSRKFFLMILFVIACSIHVVAQTCYYYHKGNKTYGSWNEEYGYGLVDAYNSVIHTPDTVYIQNETITGSRVISAEQIYIGRDVTDTKPSGNVVLGQGNITLQGRYVKINNSTTVPLGTTLVIDD